MRVLTGTGAAIFLTIQLALIDVAGAAVRVEGSVQAVEIWAENASVAEVLAALGEAFDVEIRSPAALDQPVTGSFRGALATVLARLLEDFDYVAKRGASGGIEIVYLRSSADSARAAPSAAPKVAARPAAVTGQWTPSLPPQWRRTAKSIRPPNRSVPGFGPGGFRCHRRPSDCSEVKGE